MFCRRQFMLFNKLKKRKLVQNTQPIKEYSGPPLKRAYAIGDVHGRLDLLEQLIKNIKADIEEQNKAISEAIESHIIFLGDLIDRGPDSKGVVEFLMSFQPDFAKVHLISGNHEESLVRALSGEPELISSWLDHGGKPTALSYGVDPGAILYQTANAQEYILCSAIPKSHIRFLSSFSESVQFGDYFCVHAGIRPGVPIHEQDINDLRWIRGEFLDSEQDHGLVVVHGHTIVEEVVDKSNRIAVDTGAYKSGILSAICLEGKSRRVLYARINSSR